MTRAKSGLPSDDSTGNTTGLTSLCNTSESAADLRQKALKIEQSLKLAQRYETLTLTDLALWPADSIHYKTLPTSLQEHVGEYYVCEQLRNAASNRTSAINLQFDQLDDGAHDRLASELCDIHTIILYTLHTQVIPEYTAYHTLGGEQTVHWESIPPGSDQQRKRQLVLDRMNRMQAGSRSGTQGLLLDYYGWRQDIGDSGTVHLHKTADKNFTEQNQQPASKRQNVDETATEVGSDQEMLKTQASPESVGILHQVRQLMQQQQQQQHQEQMASIQTLHSKPNDVLPVEETAVSVTAENQPYGRALNTKRLKQKDSIQRYFISLGVCTSDKPPAAEFVKSVFQQLCTQRLANELPADAAWFAKDVTYFTDENEISFKNFIRKLWNRRTQ